jgi:hypothetical protein
MAWRLSSRAMACSDGWRVVVSSSGVSRRVIRMDRWPMRSCTTSKGAPALSRGVATGCRRDCGESGVVLPAAWRYRARLCWMARTPRGRPCVRARGTRAVAADSWHRRPWRHAGATSVD